VETKEAEDELIQCDIQVTALRAEAQSMDGPLMTEVRVILTSLKLERQAYHSGAFNGNDLEKLYFPDVIERLCAVLGKRRVQSTSDHTTMMFGCDALAEKFRTLLHKLRQLKMLYRETRPLCRHEVAQLNARALSLGHWFPLAFPTSNITPKLHWVIYHIPTIAAAMGSTGQTTEQV
jgi:hypothetical protein